ncbi:MAG: LON peptidase substrate-binding domain-containing protein [Deltaproteobacteria bacterium]|nr:LON peptidase substrate-binding domain-containing protein [Deltaproteobacteria bacterium]
MEKCPSRRADLPLNEKTLCALPLFPLENTVFFPHTVLPLHIFEPRFRQMVEAALAGDRLIVVARATGTQEEVASIAGVGRILHHQRLEGGRFHLLLQGVGRVSIRAENMAKEGQLFRSVQTTLLEEEWLEPDVVGAELAEIQDCYTYLLQHMPEAACALGELPSQLCCPQVLANMLCSTVLSDVDRRQVALEENSVKRRLHMAKEALAALLLDVLRPGESAVH